MFTVRDVLERLPGTALVPLSREKGMAVSGRVEDYRTALAKHYGRRVRDLLHDLRRTDLSKLFRRPFEVDGVTYRLHNRSRHAKAELLDMALTLFVRGEIHESFTTEDLGDVEDGEEDDEAGDEEEENGDEGEGDEAEAESEGEVPAAVQGLLGWLHDGQWSAARPLKRILRIVYDQAFTRLRTARFQRLLEDLHAYGVELSFDGDPSFDPIPLDAESPGLDVMVRLRLRADDTEGGDDDDLDGEPVEDEGGGPDDLPASIRSALSSTDGVWGPARTVARLLSQMYGQEFTRLRAERFQRLVSDLDACGVELCFADDPDEQPLTLDVASPGLEARVCLRRVQVAPAVAPTPRPPQRAAVRPLPPAPEPAPVPAPAPAPTIRLIAESARTAPLGPTAKVTPYELALLRLEFLTAAPCIDRARDPQWPDGFLDAAGRGIDLDDRSRRFLLLAAKTFVSGSHDPMVRVSRLTRVLHADDWPMLLLDYERLNPDADPELVNEVLRHTAELASLPQEPVVRVPPAPPAPRPAAVAPSRAAAPAHRAPPASPRRTRGDDAGGQRDLGALGNMFDDD